MFLMILLFSFLICVPTWVVGRNCDLSDGYIRDLLDNATDNCDQECGWLRCGDVCINALLQMQCFCGGQWLNFGTYYCCVDHSPDNRTQCSVDSVGHGGCPQGRVVSKNDTCNNHCFNDYETSAVVGSLSMYHCGDKCVPARNMCMGYPKCPDSRDVSECDEDLKCTFNVNYSRRKGVLVSDLSGGHYFCDHDISHNNGEYETITREDETDLNILTRKVHINYNSITECNTTDVNIPGLMCGETCQQHSTWCTGNTGGSCGNFSTDNKQLCANTTFWKGKTCNWFYSSRQKAAVGRRCTGAIQHCSYPWYTSSINFYEVSLRTFQILLISLILAIQKTFSKEYFSKHCLSG